MVDQKMFTLDIIDEHIKRLNIRSFDGDKPSMLAGISLTATDSNLHQHGNHYFCPAKPMLNKNDLFQPCKCGQWQDFYPLLSVT